MTDDLEIRERLAAFASGDVDVNDLEMSLHEIAWDLDEEPAATFVATIMRLLAEFGNGDWPLGELRDRVGALNRLYWFEIAPRIAYADSGTNFTVCPVLEAEAGTQHVAAFV
jgi:hypothetical protein